MIQNDPKNQLECRVQVMRQPALAAQSRILSVAEPQYLIKTGL